MVWLSRFLGSDGGRAAVLTGSRQQALADWLALPAVDGKRSHYHTRYVVVDVETSGLNLKTDRLTVIGALAVVNGQIDFHDAFQTRLSSWSQASTDRERPLPSAEGADAGLLSGSLSAPVDALLDFLQFTGKAPLVAFHASFASAMIDREMLAHLGMEPDQRWIDLAWVLADLYREAHEETQGRMDAWLAHFHIESIARHRALSDAYAAAKLLQITIARAARKGFVTPASLFELERARRHMHQSR